MERMGPKVGSAPLIEGVPLPLEWVSSSPHLIAGGPHIAFSVYTMIFYKVRLKTDKKVHNKLKVL